MIIKDDFDRFVQKNFVFDRCSKIFLIKYNNGETVFRFGEKNGI